MAQDNLLVATNITYYHQNDETAFFDWLDRMECVESYRGELHDLLITLTRRPTKSDLQELLAFFFRYGIDMRQLAQFETKTNRSWLRDPQKYWHWRMFGGGS
jgi:hypothetical protein